MSGRFAIIGLTALALLALGIGTSAVPGTATAEFRVPGLFGGKKVVKRRRYRRPPPVQPVRNPDRIFAATSAKTVSPEVAKGSDTALAVGTASAASVAMALPAATPLAAKSDDSADAAADANKSDETETADADDAKSDADGTEVAAASDSGDSESKTETADASDTKPEPESTAEAEAEADSADDDKTAVTDSEPADADESASEEATAEADEADTSEAASDTAAVTEETADTKSADAKSEEDDASPDTKTADAAKEDEASDAKLADAGPDKSDTETAADSEANADEADTPVTADAEPDEDKTAGSKTADTESSDDEAAETKTADAKTADDETSGADAADEKTAKDETADDKEAEEPQSKSAATDTSKETETASADASTTSGDTADEDKLDEAADTAAKAMDTANDEAETAATAAAGAIAESKDTEADEPAKVADSTKDDDATAKDAKVEDSEDVAAKQADDENVDTKSADSKTADAKDADAEAAADADSKDVAENAEEPAEAADDSEGEIVTASLPPAPEPKPEIARMASPANTPERAAETATDPEDTEPTPDSEVTASISPSSEPDGMAQSDEAQDVTDVTRSSDEEPAEERLELDPRAYSATVVLDVSPPPGAEADGEDAKVAALEPGSARLTPDDAASESEDTEEAVDLGPPPPPPVDPVIAGVRSKLDGSAPPKVATADLEALKTLYGERDDDPLWVAEDGLTPKAKTLIATIRDADDWGLDADAYDVPSPSDTLTTDEARADAELALSAAILKYARHAQTGRMTPSSAHKLFDFHPTASDPKTVLTELAASDTPDKSLLALHPQSEQYQRLHASLVQARDAAKQSGRNPDNDRTVQLIAINMERWRWLPSDLGNFHVWNNIPEFKFRVLKGGRTIYEEKTIVGQTQYATAFFSAPMRNIVFNPNWTVPPTIVKEDIAPKLKGPQRSGGLFGGRESRNRMLSRYGLKVSKGGKPVDADAVDWQNVNVHTYTFQQDPGPHNVLGQFKFNFPNKHAIYMHDTTQKELFGRRVRTLSHGCIRVNQPARFAAFLLNEDKGWSMGTVQDILARSQGQTKVIALEHKIPVHLTYNTAIADGYGSIREFGDVYGIDNRMAAKLFKNPAHFNVPVSGPEIAETSPTQRYSEPRPRRRRTANSVDDFISGILGN
ncbi:L,D-transpeptidase family protein [Methyloceanibacter sp. wino2]|uniref:L,D-transpeptidase family protein n=1 Tax=Methyloceanibacter sp. wino2 TaxID=2170729 RepID=UPI00131F3EA8|nr:L,D-transpeptidase family protein [Methyloceanibacter sp. wino2]